MVGARAWESWAGRATGAIVALATVVAFAPAAPAAAPPVLMEFPLADGVSPFGIALGSDGAMWFTARGTDSVGRIEVDGSVGAYTQLELGADPTAIAPGGDGAVWFTEQGLDRIGRLAPDGSLTEFQVPTANAAVAGITSGPDGAMWFTERAAHKIGNVAADGSITEYALLPNAGPMGIASGPDGALWFTEQRANRIGRITTDGDASGWTLPIADSLPTGIAPGPDGALWFTMRSANRIGRITTAGEIQTWPVPTAGSDPTAIAEGWDGAMWFTGPDTDLIGRVALDGTITEFPLPQVGASPFSIAAGPDRAVWFTEGSADAIGRLAAPQDTSPPTVEIAAPLDGRVVTSSGGVVADYRCADDGGSGLETCVGTVADGAPADATPGAHRFDVTATDGAGNVTTASASYVSFASVGGSIASGTPRAGQWATLVLGFGERVSTRVSDVVAPGFPVTQQVDCPDRSTTIGAATRADVRLASGVGMLGVLWRTKRSMAGTCREITFRFVADRWSGADATFVVAFV